MADKDKKKDPERKPDYDDKDIPKVLKGKIPEGPLSPLRNRKDYGGDGAMMKEISPKDLSKEPVKEPAPVVKGDYDDISTHPLCPCQGKPPENNTSISEELMLPDDKGKGFMSILVCPDCGNEGPFNIVPPQEVPVEDRKLKCAKCETVVGFKGLVKIASGKYVVAHCMDPQFDRIKGLLKPDTILTKDLVGDILATLDKIYRKYRDLEQKGKDIA
jgi:hypothetical protein